MNPKISVITVTYNSAKHLASYFTALVKALPKSHEIIIVDSNSTDQTIDLLKKIKNKHLKIIESSQNLGFSKGCNLGAKNASGEYLFFLNPDTQIKENAIQFLLDYAKDHPEAGIVAPILIEPSGKIQPSARNLPTLLNAFKEYYIGIKNSYEAFAPSEGYVQVVESVVGGAMLIKKDLFQQLGGFNEKYFMYYEDLELCKKINNMRLKVVIVPEAKVWHEVGGSISSLKSGWLRQSAQVYHGAVGYLLLYILLKLRPHKG